MSKKRKILICIAAVLAVLLFLDCMVYPKTPPIEEWKQVAVHTSESGYWPPTDSKLDRIVIWLYLRTALPIGTEESYIECLKREIDKYGADRGCLNVNVTDWEPGKMSVSYQFVIAPVYGSILFDRVSFYDQSQGEDATYWITFPGFWRYLDRVHTRLRQEILEGKL